MHRIKRWRILFCGLIVLGICIVGLYLWFWAPYNLSARRHQNSFGIQNQRSFLEIEELQGYFHSEDIQDVNYLGTDTYEVNTDQGKYIVRAHYHAKQAFWLYDIYKLDQQLEHFTNPM